MRLLVWTIVAWGAVIAISAFATSYTFLLVMRIALGAVAASAAPAIASLVGDYFPAEERGAVYSTVLAADAVGSGLGFLVSGELATWTWRAGFIPLAVPALLLARVVHTLAEPERGGAHQRRQQHRQPKPKHERQTSTDAVVPGSDAQPRSELALTGDPSRRSLWWVLRYVLRIPTNRVLIVASALGYFYFTGLRTFGVECLGL